MDFKPEDFVNNIANNVFNKNDIFEDYNEIQETEDSLRPDYDTANLNESLNDLEDIKQYRIGDIVKILNLKHSTIRDWDQKFSKFLKTKRTSGGQRLYTAPDIKIFAKIKEKYEEGYNINIIHKLLKDGDHKVSKESLKSIQRKIDRINFKIDNILKEIEEKQHLV